MRRQRLRKKSDSWQTIYMDLMTIIMVFFIILWSINQSKDMGVSETIGDQTARVINLPGDVLFSAGKIELSSGGKDILAKIFDSSKEGISLNLSNSGLSKRLLVIHGHTDNDGSKDANLELGYRRALSAYHEIKKYDQKLPEHIVVCSHADNTPEQEVPKFKGRLSKSQKSLLKEAKQKNRRITIEDKLLDQFGKQ